MTANELRFGNHVLVKHSDWDEFEEVKITNGDSLDTYFMDMWEIKPIPLDEEWLLKFGFEKSGYKPENKFYWFRSNSGLLLGITLEDILYPFFDIDNPLPIKKDVLKYVHQLQNLYFALTCEELKQS